MEPYEDLVHELLKINTKAAMEAVLEHTLSLLRLNPKEPWACAVSQLFSSSA
jgi:hypothetical protein